MKIFRNGLITTDSLEALNYMTPNEIRKALGLNSLKDHLDELSSVIEKESDNRITNCKNCGAPLTKNGYCEYCRTQY